MARKTHDLTIVTGEYQDRDGQTKKRYQNVGALMEGDNGPYILLERWFNPAGVTNPQNRPNLIISCFEPRDRNATQGDGSRGGAPAGGASSNAPAFDDDIPFSACVLL